MAILLSLLTAAVYGAADFCGGLATRRLPVVQVVGGSHVIGGVGVFAASFLLAERFQWADLFLGAASGIFGVIGVGLLYRRLAVGPMNIVAPLTGITAAVIPMLWGVADGDRLSGLGWLGIALGLVAVLLVSIQPSGPAEPVTDGESTGQSDVGGGADSTLQVVVESLLAGAGFGVMFIMLDATEDATAPWPIFGARLLTSTVLLPTMIILARRDARVGSPVTASLGAGTIALVALVGLLDTGANVIFLFATNVGQLTVVSVLSSLYPIATVVLARLFLAERMSRLQGFGFITAIVATELIVLG